MTREQLESIPGRQARDAELVGIQAFVEAGPTQSHADGLHVTVELRNDGDEQVELRNPFELLQWELLAQDGSPLRLPRRAPSLLVHRSSDRPWTLDSTPALVEVRRDGAVVETSALDAPTLIFAPSQAWSATFAIGHTVDGAGKQTELPDRSYLVSCSATLIEAGDPGRSAIVRSAPVQLRLERA